MSREKVPGASNYPLSPILPDGYHHSFGGERDVPPPSPDPSIPVQATMLKRNISPLMMSNMNETEVKIAVEKHVPPKDLKKVQGMVFSKIESSCSYFYGMRTFSESRSTKWVYATYKNQSAAVDGPENGKAPGPWDINAQPDEIFKDDTKWYKVDHTEQVVQCESCMACGILKCSSCVGVGNNVCTSCAGKGVKIEPPDMRTCTWCDGEEEKLKDCSRCRGSGVRDLMGKQETCNKCKGNGEVICSKCDGIGQHNCDSCEGGGLRKYYVRLIVQWKTRYHTHIFNDCGLDHEVITNAPKVRVFEESDTTIAPIISSDFFDPQVASVSADFYTKQVRSDEKVIRMNHWISGLPITIVTYQRKANDKKKWEYFHVYGDDHKVHSKSPLEGKGLCSIL